MASFLVFLYPFQENSKKPKHISWSKVENESQKFMLASTHTSLSFVLSGTYNIPLTGVWVQCPDQHAVPNHQGVQGCVPQVQLLCDAPWDEDTTQVTLKTTLYVINYYH